MRIFSISNDPLCFRLCIKECLGNLGDMYCMLKNPHPSTSMCSNHRRYLHLKRQGIRLSTHCSSTLKKPTAMNVCASCRLSLPVLRNSVPVANAIRMHWKLQEERGSVGDKVHDSFHPMSPVGCVDVECLQCNVKLGGIFLVQWQRPSGLRWELQAGKLGGGGGEIGSRAHREKHVSNCNKPGREKLRMQTWGRQGKAGKSLGPRGFRRYGGICSSPNTQLQSCMPSGRLE